MDEPNLEVIGKFLQAYRQERQEQANIEEENCQLKSINSFLAATVDYLMSELREALTLQSSFEAETTSIPETIDAGKSDGELIVAQLNKLKDLQPKIMESITSYKTLRKKGKKLLQKLDKSIKWTKCNKCEKLFGTEHALATHHRYYCGKKPSYTCKHCGREPL